MQLLLTKTVTSPLGRHLHFVHALEVRGAFLISDGEQGVLLNTDGGMESIADLNAIEAAFEPEVLSKPVDGFKPLSRAEQRMLQQSDSYKSAREYPDARRAHDDALLFFSGRSVALLQPDGDKYTEVSRIRTKGRQPIRWALSPVSNLLLYGTNHGELYGQTFNRDRFLKSFKIDQLPNTCYQITFSPDGRRLFVAGLGFMRMYHFDDDVFTLTASLATAARSFELVDEYLILNKGMHGLDVIRIRDQPERVSSLDLPLAINKMYYLASRRTFLLTFDASDKWGLMTWDDYK